MSSILRRLSRATSSRSDGQRSSSLGSADVGVSFAGHVKETWKTIRASGANLNHLFKSLKDVASEADSSMSLSDKSEDPIEYTRKEEELHQLVEKLDIVPKEAECKCSGVLAQEDPEDFDTEPSMMEFDKVYQSGVSAIVNATGRLPQNKEVYEEFLMEACGMGPEKHQALKRRSLQEIAELSLHVGVRRAKDLIAKDNTGTSDPYCRVALVHEREVKKPLKDLSHWQEKGVVNTVLETPVVQKNLNPEWNKNFQLVLLDPHTEFLAVEVWDSDEDSQSLSKTKGIGGFVNYLQDLSKKDDFLGKLYVPLQELAVEETAKWYDLVSRKGKPRGAIELHLQVHSKLQSMDEEAAMTMFTQMYRLLVSHERRQKGEFALCWDGALCQTAKEILRLLATRLGLDRLQQAVCKIHVLFRNKVLYPTAVLVEVKEICACRAQLDAEETRNKPWVENLMSSFKAMVKIVKDYIRDHQFKVDLKTAENVQMVGEMLQLMQVIYNIDSFVIMLDKDFANMKAVIQIALQGSSVRWYQQLLSSSFEFAEAQNVQNRILITTGALRGMMNFLARSRGALQEHFTRVGVDYFQIVYLDVDKQLAGDLESVINSENGGKCDPTDSFMLFDTVRAFMAMGKQLPEGMQEQLKLTGCYSLFQRHVTLWIDERMVRFEQGMWKAIKVAEATPIAETVKYTTAVRDTIDLMVRVCSFWKTLQWPDPEESIMFLHIMTKQLCEKMLLFVDHMAKKLQNSGYYLEEREKEDVILQFVSEKMCVYLNDIQQLQEALLDTPNYLEWAEQKASLPQDVAIARVFESLQTILESCDDDMHHKMVNLYEDICHCLEPSLRSAVMYTLDTKKSLEEVLPFLMGYLTEMLAELYNGLFHSVFMSFLLPLWTQLVNIFSDIANDDKDKQTSERIFMVLGALLSFFNNEGEGLAHADLMTKTYQELHTVLDLRLMPTNKVIEAYYKDLLEYQKTTPASRGSVSVVASYVEARNQLDFTLVKGSDLPAMDLTPKSSDPFAVISLVPGHVFKGVKSEKTKTHKHTLSPQFNTDLQFHVEGRDRSVKGAAVLIEVFDYDRLSSNDAIGVALVSLQSIPAISSSDDSSLTSSSQRLVETIPLFVPVDSPALAELTNRAMGKKDLNAYEFVKKVKKLRSV